ncbi:MAG TPA: DUF3322 domain-containing protein [Noviherbaspirillum sp.]
MSWTTPADLRAQLQKLWDKGDLLAAMAGNEPRFPLRLRLKGPTSTELSERFDAVRSWIGELQSGAKTDSRVGYRLVMRHVRHRVLGANAVPDEAWADTLDDAVALIGKQREAERFRKLLAHTADRLPILLPWLHKRPLRALELAAHWPALLDVVAWIAAHPRPGIYLRQVDIPGVHTKFLEAHRGVLSELLDLALPSDTIDSSFSGTNNFARRYGFRDKPARVRFRLLDPGHVLAVPGTEQDFTVCSDTFARLSPGVTRVFITENEINFLAFPPLADSLIVFGAGYGFDMLDQAEWLHERTVFYWGDIDTHGFAILDQLRGLFPHVRSFLMDRATLLAHRSQWGEEAAPCAHELPRLDAEERALYDDLRDQRLGRKLRLEQEKIPFGWIEQALMRLQSKA